MTSWITKRRILNRQDAKSLHTRNQENDKLGHPTENMDITWSQQCITTGVKMSTSRPRLVNTFVDTLKFFPHNFQMPQLSFTDRLMMEANDMSNALKNPHPEVPFSHIGDDTITALTIFAEIFKKKVLKSSHTRTSNCTCQGL
jgi:hypothetical protein